MSGGDAPPTPGGTRRRVNGSMDVLQVGALLATLLIAGVPRDAVSR